MMYFELDHSFVYELARQGYIIHYLLEVDDRYQRHNWQLQ